MLLDALIINPGNQAETYQSLAGKFTAIEPSIWSRLLGSYLQARGHSVELIDAVPLGLSPQGVAELVVAAEPRLVIVLAYGHQPSASTQQMPAVIATCEALEKDCSMVPLLVVGGHPAALPEQTLRETSAYFVATGEGLVTADALLVGLKENGWPYKNKWLTNVPGLCYWDMLATRITPPAANVNLADVPGGLWDQLPMAKYRAHNWHCLSNGLEPQPYASIYTSLNCPYQCAFCCISQPFKRGDAIRSGGKDVNYYRTWNSDAVIKEIETLVEVYGVRNLKIADEMFLLNRGHVFDICNKIIERGYGELLNIWSYGRVDCTNEEFLDVYRRAGGKWICLGIEGVSEGVRDGVEKNDYGAEDIIKTCQRIKAHDINIIANFIYGLPDDDRQSIMQNYNVMIEIMPEWANIYCAVAYPGTALYDQAVANGWKLPESWSGYSHHAYDYQPLPTKHLSAEQVLEYRDWAFGGFYNDAGYLAYLGRRFGPMAVDMVREMVNVPLRRKLLGD